MKFFNYKKTGFTLGETLIVLLIVTILTVFSIITIRPRSNTTPLLYNRAYEALNVAVYNAWLETGDKDQIFGSDTVTLCKQLAGREIGYINIDNKSTVDAKGDPTSCGNAALTIPTSASENFTAANAHFTASNSMRFYISEELSGSRPLNTYVDSAGSPVKSKWYIIFVDLDGEKGLNTMKQPSNQNNTADVVAFALVVDPEEAPSVIPIGVPTMDKRYMTAVVKYTNNENGNNRKSPGMTYKEAVTRAYGVIGSGNTTIPERIYFENLIGSSNSLFYAKIPKDLTLDCDCKYCDKVSSDYKTECKDQCKGMCPFPKAPADVFGIIEPGCETDQIGACSVIVNSYTGTSRR